MSLRTRLLLALLVAATVGLAIVDLATYTLVTSSQIDQVDQELERAHPPIEQAASELGDRERSIRDTAPGFYVELRDPGGVTILAVALRRPGDEDDTITLIGVDLPQPAPGHSNDDAVFASVSSGEQHGVRVRVSRQPDDNVLVIGRSLEPFEDTRTRLLAVLAAATLGALVIMGFLGAWLVRVGLHPLVAVERAAGEITDSELDRRVPGDDQPTEVGRLAVAINTMLTRLNNSFDQRERDLAALQESEARMRRFVADASHELRTPIAATAAYAELFERGARDRPDDLARAMAGIRSETDRMSELVEDLLLLAQLDEGRPLAREPVDLAEIVFEAVDAARTLAPDRPVELQIDEVAFVDGDASRLRQVVDNLLGNVRMHTPSRTTCAVALHRNDEDVVLTVHDNGPGLPAADAERAFDRFHRADMSRARASGGAGLGLSIVAAIVAAHHGTAELTSAPGEGVTVSVRLPIAEPRTAHQPTIEDAVP